MPVMRTFVPVVAGIGQMPYGRYTYYSSIGAVAWIVSLTTLGYFVGLTPLGKHIELVIIAIVVLSVMPGVIAWIKSRRGAAETPAPDTTQV
jgi:membrane-associated protein